MGTRVSKWGPMWKQCFWTNRLDPPPTPPLLGQQKKWCLFCILGYSKHIFFNEKLNFFGWDNDWGVQYPHELIRYCTPIYVLCVSSYFWRFFKANLVLEKFDKNLGLGQTPALLVGPKDQVFRKIEGSPNRDPFWQNVHYFTNLRTLM